MRSGLFATAAASLFFGVSQAQTINVDGKPVGMSLPSQSHVFLPVVFYFCRFKVCLWSTLATH